MESHVVAEAMPGMRGVWAPAVFVYDGSRIVKTICPIEWGNYKSEAAAQAQADWRRKVMLGLVDGSEPERHDEWTVDETRELLGMP